MNTPVRLAELMMALSTATDLGMGQPMEFALCACVLAMRLGEKLGLNSEQMRELFYQSLLRYIGCNVDTHVQAALLGDEIAVRQKFATLDTADTPAIASLVLRSIRQAHQGSSPLRLLRTMSEGLLTFQKVSQQVFAGHCEVAQQLAERFGFKGNIVQALGQLYERWDGKGLPFGLKGEAIAFSVRLVTLAQDMVIFHRLEGVETAVTVAQQRRGTMYEPRLVDAFCQNASHLLSELEVEPSWHMVLALEPPPIPFLTAAQLDTACQAIAHFADIKSPYTLGHSLAVADIVTVAARQVGVTEQGVTDLQRAGWLHNIGRTAVSTGIWMKAGPLTEKEWEQVRLYPYYTERILARPPALAPIGSLAALHAERLDGSGYHRRLPATVLPMAARLLMAAFVYTSLLEPRPYRPAFTPETAVSLLRQEVKNGRLDHEAVNAVLSAAGHTPATRRESVAGLTEREITVLRLVARGMTMQQMAVQLVISKKTVDSHIQHIYHKIGVSTRAGATLFAMENQML